jgi:Raf kinase inhibitor-like YbhB/YbcL family protein
MWIRVMSLLFLAALPAGARADPPRTSRPSAARAPATLEVSSSAFAANQAIPPEFTCDGSQRSPPLSWSEVPAGTRSIALLVDDPDSLSGNFTHWLVTGIPPGIRALPAGGPLPPGAVAAKNGNGEIGYTGPCPYSGRHRYVFRIMALDASIKSPRNQDELYAAIQGHVLARGQLGATYSRTTTPD